VTRLTVDAYVPDALDAARLQGMELGAVDFITKPIDPVQLKLRVDNFMRYVELRRHLQAEGTSYQSILDDVRCNLAKHYLQDTRMTGEDIATALGFSDSANFRHAFHKWASQSPSEFRRRANRGAAD
jgi:YesN/AraC family two-component response regulator